MRKLFLAILFCSFPLLALAGMGGGKFLMASAGGTNPTLSTVAVGTNGTSYTFTYNQAVQADTTAHLCSPYSLTWTTAGAVTFHSYSSGTGTTTVKCNANPAVNSGDTVSAGLNYSSAYIVASSGGAALLAISGKSVTNNSTRGGTNLTVDIWQSFELAGATPDATNLLASDHKNGSETWTVMTGVTNVTGASKNMISTVNTLTDSGTYGIACDIGNNGRIWVDLHAVPTSVSTGFWYKGNPGTPDFADIYMASNDGYATTNIVSVRNTNTTGTYTLKLVGATTSSAVTIDSTSWWWVTVLAVNNGTCNMSVYNASGVLQGSEVTATGGSHTGMEFLTMGSLIASTSATGTGDFDNWVINTVTPTYPLGP